MAVCDDTDYSSICGKLDDLALQILNVMQNIISERQYLDDNLKEGFINMAKSRYLMSGRKISILQINSVDLKASKKVISNFDSVDGIKYSSFCISNFSKVDNEMDDQSHPDVVNRSNKLITTNYRKEEIGSLDDDSSNDKKLHTSDNPLHWFGVLVPESLKICQSRFEQAVHTSTKIASLQSQLKVLSEEYRRLRKKKSQLSS